MEFKIKSAEFKTSIADINVYKSLAATYDMNEICVVGRSNVGKSTFINMLAGKKLAKTSSSPGRTRLINLFCFKNSDETEFMMVDLPGYGYAEAAKKEKSKWGDMIEGYLTDSSKFKHVFALVDSRHEPTAQDKQMINFLYHYALPFTVIATKCDKLSNSEASRNISKIASALSLGIGNIIPVSAEKKQNKDKVEQRIKEILESRIDS